MTTAALGRRLAALAARAATEARHLQTAEARRHGPIRDDPNRSVGVIVILLRAGVLDRYCVGCAAPAREPQGAIKSILEFEWGGLMPWDMCARCGLTFQQ